jgi:hypothetical protein
LLLWQQEVEPPHPPPLPQLAPGRVHRNLQDPRPKAVRCPHLAQPLKGRREGVLERIAYIIANPHQPRQHPLDLGRVAIIELSQGTLVPLSRCLQQLAFGGRVARNQQAEPACFGRHALPLVLRSFEHR